MPHKKSSRATTKPSSPARAAASRRNGSKSRGPKTPQGKARSSQNALKHGLCAADTALLRTENPDLFAQLKHHFRETLHPTDPVEDEIVRNLFHSVWSLRRVERHCAELTDHEASHPELLQAAACLDLSSRPELREALAFRILCEHFPETMTLLQRYAAHHARNFSAALRDLKTYRECRDLTPQLPLLPPDSAWLLPQPHPNLATAPHELRNEPEPPANSQNPHHIGLPAETPSRPANTLTSQARPEPNPASPLASPPPHQHESADTSPTPIADTRTPPISQISTPPTFLQSAVATSFHRALLSSPCPQACAHSLRPPILATGASSPPRTPLFHARLTLDLPQRNSIAKQPGAARCGLRANPSAPRAPPRYRKPTRVAIQTALALQIRHRQPMSTDRPGPS